MIVSSCGECAFHPEHLACDEPDCGKFIEGEFSWEGGYPRFFFFFFFFFQSHISIPHPIFHPLPGASIVSAS